MNRDYRRGRGLIVVRRMEYFFFWNGGVEEMEGKGEVYLRFKEFYFRIGG